MTDQHSTADSAQNVHRLERQRRDNRRAIAELGFNPYGRRADGLIALDEARRLYDADADAHHKEHAKDEVYEDRRPVVRVAGRIQLHRDNGKLVWMNLRDESGDLQVAVSKRDCDERGFALAKLTDLGDVVVAEGPLVKTRTGEVTVWASSLWPAAKCVEPPPEKWSGLQDPELRYRQRYVDLWANPDVMRVFRLRSRIVSTMRSELDGLGYLEVETPMLQALAGGAAARPFQTHMNALDIDLFLRIAPELYLKRLLVGGLRRVYEINRNFRNEGVDRRHNPEFTMAEIYEAFGNYTTMMELTERLVRSSARLVATSPDYAALLGEDQSVDPDALLLPYGDIVVDFGSPFMTITYADLFERALGFPMSDEARVRAVASEHGFDAEGKDISLVVSWLFEREAEPTLDPTRPTFVIDYPSVLCPLTRPSEDDPSVAERFELFIASMEIANAYTELNDPDVQERRFREQIAGVDEEEATFRTLDHDFLRALRVGMPPAGGLGIGVDRVVMLMTNQRSIRDVILYPFMRPEVVER